MKFKRGLKNIIFGLISQLLMMALGLIIPRFFVMKFGSAVNGLFSSITQLMGYVALLEAGIGTATVQALYKHVASKDRDGISSVLSATRIYYRRVSLYYLLCVIGLSFIYPMLIDTRGIPFEFMGLSGGLIVKVAVGLVTFIAGIAGVVNFYFQATLKQLLIAEGRGYVTSNITLIIELLMSAVKIALIYSGANIVLIQLGYMSVNLFQLFLYSAYFKKKYYWVNFDAKPDFESIKQKNAFLIHQISLLIFSNTDTLVISMAGEQGLVYASIYTTYNFVIHALHKLCNTLNNSLLFMLGITFHEDRDEYIKLHDAYNTYYIAFIFSVISVCYLLFRPFILIYTADFDFNYDMPYLPLLFCLVQLLSSVRMVSVNLINIAGHAKATVPRTITEAAINLAVSFALVWPLGIYGVLIGTVAALLYRSNDIIIYTTKHILKRSYFKSYKPVIVNFAIFAVVVFAEKFVVPSIANYGQFFLYGILFSMVIIPAYFVINSLVSPAEYRYVINVLKSKILKKQRPNKV
ncbi:MAG: hypothetical protein IJF58_01310 [Clostridia bacterium]|nr:hypothetical protein [Clostridia bacterium]